MAEVTENKEVFSIDQIEEPKDIHDIVFNLMVNPNLAPVNYFNDFSDEGVQLENLASDETDDSGIFTTDSGDLMSMTTHAFHHHLERDPQTATEILISRAARRMICFGAKPQAVSAFLYHINIADPNGQFIASGAKKGLENAAEKFGIKVSDRKIRFDYFSNHGPVLPTIIISMMGSVKDKEKVLTHHFKSKGNNIFVLGKSHECINSSEYLEFYHEVGDSPLPVFNLDVEVKLHQAMDALIEKGLITSASPVGKGGLFFSLMRAGMPAGLGFDITTDAEIRRDAFLFGEAMGRLIVGVPQEKADDFVDYMQTTKIPFFALGHITRGEIRIDDESFGFIDKMNPLA
ncbi:AIR synthase-related protein [Mangrovibacterium marinum]|uniref:Phosphoribosylformylglycinamidine synthase n=1 Tax=Mangrovibacterium marinum TaxID=1639118 RepID=A0A2T5C5J6_9BACT|nr:AIR synthase-related protein [Mangrovibacterium marinum]PTN10161.1 phosphoribosylformylglycinamidine synthase [Mangrovibacterium marinum]